MMQEALDRAGTVPSLRRRCLHRQMQLALRLGRYDEVDRLAEELLSNPGWMNAPAFNEAAYFAGMALALRGRHAAARRWFQDALDQDAPQGRNIAAAFLCFGLAFTEHRAGHIAEARHHLHTALQACAESHDLPTGLVSLQLARTIAQQTRHSDASRIAALARRCQELMGVSPWPFTASGEAGTDASVSPPSDANRSAQVIDAITTVGAIL